MTQTIQSELSPEYISPVKQDIPSNAYDIFTDKEYVTIVKAHDRPWILALVFSTHCQPLAGA